MRKVCLILLTIMPVFFSGCLGLLDITDEMDMRRRQANIERYLEEHPELDERIRELILNRKVDTGMTKEQVKLSSYYYDYYKHRIEPTSKYGADEVWIYKTIIDSELVNHERLYFKDDTLIKIEKVKN